MKVLHLFLSHFDSVFGKILLPTHSRPCSDPKQDHNAFNVCIYMYMYTTHYTQVYMQHLICLCVHTSGMCETVLGILIQNVLVFCELKSTLYIHCSPTCAIVTPMHAEITFNFLPHFPPVHTQLAVSI